MNDVLMSQIALAYAPMIDRSRAVSATRLTVFPLRPGAALDAQALRDAVLAVWPEGGRSVLLNAQSEALLNDLLRAPLPAHVVLEVPAFMATDPACTDALAALHAQGGSMLLKGRAVRDLPAAVLPCFKTSVLEAGDLAAGNGAPRKTGHVLAGVTTQAEVQAAFDGGASAVLGWPFEAEPPPLALPAGAPAAKAAGPDLQVMVELIQRVDKAEPIEKLEDTLRRDPTLAFKLMRYINSPAFGLSVEISSFRHAIMMLGYNRLKRWLALLLATASKDANLKPVMFAAVRRGMLMEELVRHLDDEEMRNELFICGVFSLLDRMFKQPFGELLKSIPVPERVFQALVDRSGPYAPYCALVRACEGSALDPIRDGCERLMTTPAEANEAVLRALAKASQLD